ncbi:MAG: DUF2817 domain-containing protein [Bdellovibrionales bacterium]|nr:DUF2817 domain-containing protein [Bdellovibrionales bacterium]
MLALKLSALFGLVVSGARAQEAPAVAVEVSTAQTLSVTTSAATPEAPPALAPQQLLCAEIEHLYARQGWGQSECDKIPFEIFGQSVQGRPLLSFRTARPPKENQKVPKGASKLTVVQCGIHGDELPSLAMCFKLIHEILIDKKQIPPGHRLVVQPLLNPDGMFGTKPTRNNANGVDINRNFPTKNWTKEAQASWKKLDHGDRRKFPGERANSETETQAIASFVEREHPQKIISIHTPLGFLDLDARGGNPDRDRRARYLAINMVKNSGNYKFRTFGFYPGSLGNFAGNERKIPVYTLELPSGDSRPTVDSYWKRFRVGLWRAIKFDLDTGQFTED